MRTRQLVALRLPHVDVLILNRAEVEELLDLPTLLAVLRDGFTALTAR